MKAKRPNEVKDTKNAKWNDATVPKEFMVSRLRHHGDTSKGKGYVMR